MSEITRDQLMAYADGQLPEDERAAVDAFLAANPDAAADVALLQRQSDAIRTLFEHVGGEPVAVRVNSSSLAGYMSRVG